MIAVLGTKIDEIKTILDSRSEKNGICEIANDNAEGQVILSGEKQSIESIQLFLKEKKLNQFL